MEAHLKYYCPELRLWTSRPVCRLLLARPSAEEVQVLISGEEELLEPVRPFVCESCPHRPEKWLRKSKKSPALRRIEKSRWLDSVGHGSNKSTKQERGRIVTCIRCGEVKPHHARGMCFRCYDKVRPGRAGRALSSKSQ